ncbi:MAG: methionyl-tRNA formyltransferase, partial [Candidatus Azotimanducaceae bacterium]
MRVLFAGTPTFASLHLLGLLKAKINIVGVITQPDKIGKRGKKTIPSEVKKLALSQKIPIIQPDKLSAADIAPFSPDLLIVVAYGQLLRQAVLDLPSFGCINVHGSLLPRWRGAAPIQRAILEGDSETGVCIIQMDKGLDTGDILSQRS